MPEPTTPKTFSELTVEDLTNYLRLSEVSTKDEELLGQILEASKSHVLTYTGRTETDADSIPEFVIAVYVLSQSMYDVRAYEVDTGLVNNVLMSILGSRSVNLL